MRFLERRFQRATLWMWLDSGHPLPASACRTDRRPSPMPFPFVWNAALPRAAQRC